MHFHFLMANEVPGEYDYLMIACGPVTLADRIENPREAVAATYGAGLPATLRAGTRAGDRTGRLRRPVRQQHRQGIVGGAQGQPADRLDNGTGRQPQARPLRQRGDAQDGFGEPEGRAGADPRADAERDIAVALARGGVFAAGTDRG